MESAMAGIRRSSSALIIAFFAALVAAACAQFPTQPVRGTVGRAQVSRPRPAVDSLTCLNGYTVSNGIVTCN
jgi:hypothetical protein